MDNKVEYTKAMVDMFKQSGSLVREQALAATHELAKAVESPIRQQVLAGDIVGDIFQPMMFERGVAIEFPLGLITPGTEKNWVAYTIPNHGRIPEQHIEGDIVTVKTYEIAAAIDWLLKFSQDGRFDVFENAVRIMRDQFVKKLNDDGFALILVAGLERNLMIFDNAASAGVFSKRLITLMQTEMRRRAGGNSASVNRGTLTDLYLSPEGLDTVRNWGTADVDEITRREIYVARDGGVNRIFGVNLHDLDELGVGQQYQAYYLNQLGGTLAGGDSQLVIGLDLSGTAGGNGNFVMPIREELQIFEDDTLHRQRRVGLYGWQEQGLGVLDNRRVLLGSF